MNILRYMSITNIIAICQPLSINCFITIGSSSSMGSYFRGENLSDFELDELNSGNDSGNDNTGKIYEFIPDSISPKI